MRTVDKVKRDEINLANWREHPWSSFSFQAVSEFVPSVPVVLPRAVPDAHPEPGPLAGLEVEVDGRATPLLDYLAASYTDAFIVLRDGEPIAGWHAPHCDPARPHLIFSISKSVTGLLAGIAVGDGRLDPDALVSTYVPMPQASAYATARVRDLLDMTVALDFDEEYTDRDSAFDRYRRAMLWNPERADAVPQTMETFLGTLGPAGDGEHARRFYYASPNTDLLGLVLERAVGERYHLYLRDRLFAPMGMTGPAFITVDRVGSARAAGGISLTVADLARLGELVRTGGRAADGRTVVPSGWIEDLVANGDRSAWVEGNFAGMFAEGRYRSCWYQTGDDRGSFCGVGIHGQWVWTDPQARITIAKVSSRPEASDDAALAREIAVLSHLTRALDDA